MRVARNDCRFAAEGIIDFLPVNALSAGH
jgi:hypothetical protein